MRFARQKTEFMGKYFYRIRRGNDESNDWQHLCVADGRGWGTWAREADVMAMQR